MSFFVDKKYIPVIYVEKVNKKYIPVMYVEKVKYNGTFAKYCNQACGSKSLSLSLWSVQLAFV